MSEVNQKTISKGFILFSQRWLEFHWRSLLLIVFGVYLPLAIFIILATQIWQHEGGLAWDTTILMAIHQTAQTPLDWIATYLTKFGTRWGVIPFTVVFSLVLIARKRWRSFLYFLITMTGCGITNLTAKALLHRVRPRLWEYQGHTDFSFPSGHAMASMALIAALIVLTQRTHWCKWIVFVGGAFVVAIGWTRLYLGVHYPSDIIAGWMLSITWAVGVSFLVKPQPLVAVRPVEETIAQEP
ncbi:MAG TPA: phosphatase PAP2 family protein [Allocoleopsis sp.]